MNKNQYYNNGLFVISLVLFVSIISSCTSKLNFDDVATEEFLSKPYEELEPYIDDLSKFALVDLNQLMKLAFQVENPGAMLALVEAGANGDIHVKVRWDEMLYMVVAKRSSIDIYSRILRKIVINYPELLNTFVDVNNGGTTTSLFHQIAQDSNPELVRLAIDYGGDPNLVDGSFYTPFLLSLNSTERMENYAVADMLIDAGTDVTVVNVFNENILHLFVWFPFEEDYERLLVRILDSGVDINQQDLRGYTPLHSAVTSNRVFEQNSLMYVKFLIDMGADISQVDNDSNPAFVRLEHAEAILRDVMSEEERIIYYRLWDLLVPPDMQYIRSPGQRAYFNWPELD